VSYYGQTLMTTDKTRIQAYLTDDLMERFEAFKQEHGIKGDSKALLKILEMVLSPSCPKQDLSDYALKADLETAIAALKTEFLEKMQPVNPSPPHNTKSQNNGKRRR